MFIHADVRYKGVWEGVQLRIYNHFLCKSKWFERSCQQQFSSWMHCWLRASQHRAGWDGGVSSAHLELTQSRWDPFTGLQTAVGECHNFVGGWQQANCMTARRFPTLKPMEQQTGPVNGGPKACYRQNHQLFAAVFLCRKLCCKCYKRYSKKLKVPLMVVA